jgi:thiamine kinase-like enzyme
MQLTNLQTLIPPARLSAVEKAIQKAFNTETVSDIELLVGGLSGSAVYKITVNHQKYVLKLDTPQSQSDQISAIFACREIAAKAGIAPILYYQSEEDALSITAFIEKKPLQATFSSQEEILSELAKTIKAMHDMPAFPKENSLLETVDTLIRQTRETPMFTQTLFEDFLEYYDIIQNNYPWHDKDKVPSHNDLNPSNIIGDGERIWIVDWDAAFQNDRYVDLAITANFMVRTEAQEKVFLEAYFGDTLNDYKTARFFIMRQICRLVYAMLMFKLACTANSNCINEIDETEIQKANLREIGEQFGTGKLSLSTWKGQLLLGKALLNEALRNVRSSRFTSSIEYLATGNLSVNHP